MSDDQPPAAASSETTTSTDSAAAPVVDTGASGDVASSAAPSASSAAGLFRVKKVRKRGGAIRGAAAATPLGDTADAPDDEEDTTNLHAIRAIQDLRSKRAGALQLGEVGLHLPDRELAAAAAARGAAEETLKLAAAPSLGQEFGTTTEGGQDAQSALIDQQMEKYIADQLAARRALRQPQKKSEDAAGDADTAAAAPINLSEDQLYVTPAHLAIHSVPAGEAEEAGERWLTGISEQPLSVRERMRNIEKTEAAKAAFLASEAAKRAAASSAPLVLPANYNANFRLHKREWDGRRRDEFRTFLDAQNRAQALAQGMPAPAPTATREGPSLVSQVNALPGFLAGGVEEARLAQRASRPNRPGAQQGPNATDDRVVDRFIKRFKYK